MSSSIYFYYPNEIPITLDYKSGLDCWILKTFWKLKEYKNDLNIHLVNYVPDEGIIIFHKGFFPKAIVPSNAQLFVCIQADYGRHQYAQYHIAQNPLGVSNFNFSKRSFLEEKLFSFTKSYFIAHWNQNGIIKRNTSRGECFENVCFYGIEPNFPKDLLEPSFREKLKSEGVELKTITDSSQWNDYSETDCVLAIRDFNSKSHFNKPFSKIINGYLAGVPVIAGNESSALYLKNKLKIDMPIVKSKEECFEAIKVLKNEYKKRLNEVQIDNEKLFLFKDNAIVLEWEKLIEELQQKFIFWQKSSTITKKIFYQFCRI
jgi:hypothetical protein